ncbi:YecA family protein [Candidatus Leptofilum sp.]|uniref:YecA family protein n=1 Tax=Candidatus Leptofilum sp. TaxID=3241576 RepID=UPI003B5A4A47
MMTKPGRNDPCHCGSGLKYKKCHMKEDQAAEKERSQVQHAANFIRRDLLSFARDERFAEAFALGLPLYWNDYYDASNAEQMSQPEALRFFDWFVFDNALEDGRRLIELYAEEKMEDLSSHQQEIAADWVNVGAGSLYKLTAYEGQMLTLRDYFTEEEFTVYEGGGRGNVELEDVIITRLVPVADRMELSTTAAYLPADEITDIKEKVEAAKEAFVAEHPDADHTEFMRKHSHLLVHHALQEAKNQGRPPVSRLDANRTDAKMQKIARGMARFKR